MNSERRQRLLVIAALVCVGVLACDKLVVPPLYNLWSARAGRITELKELIEKGEVLADREGSVTRKWEAMNESGLPDGAAEAENLVLNSVNDWARDSRLSVMSLKPRWTQDKGDYRKLEVRAVAQGGLASVVRFLYALETAPLALRVDDLELTSRDDRGGSLTVDLRFSGLVLAEEEG